MITIRSFIGNKPVDQFRQGLTVHLKHLLPQREGAEAYTLPDLWHPLKDIRIQRLGPCDRELPRYPTWGYLPGAWKTRHGALSPAPHWSVFFFNPGKFLQFFQDFINACRTQMSKRRKKSLKRHGLTRSRGVHSGYNLRYHFRKKPLKEG